MESVTSISNYLNELIKEFKEEYKISFWFAEILGKRWSYLAGEREISDYITERIQLNERLGMVVNDWGEIGEGEKGKIISLVKEKIREVKL
ncbi:MAG: hypothetical protein NC920_03545 [Candidatus Omnitrophica bacterium]|nr:hypothetical protein [Candidatus Omnitrophota bacterium]